MPRKVVEAFMWMFYRNNYYGGRIFKHTDGWKAIECFNYYYHPIGFSVSDEHGMFVGYVRSVEELP